MDNDSDVVKKAKLAKMIILMMAGIIIFISL